MACVELCSVSALAKDVCRGVVESEFLMLVEPASPLATIKEDTDVGGTNGEDGLVQNRPIH